MLIGCACGCRVWDAGRGQLWRELVSTTRLLEATTRRVTPAKVVALLSPELFRVADVGQATVYARCGTLLPWCA